MLEKNKKQITIDEGVYNQLKDYCDLNHLTMTSMATKYIREGLMTEKYGDAPFMVLKKKNEAMHIDVAASVKKQQENTETSADMTNIKIVVSKPISSITQDIVIKKAASVEENTNTITVEEKNEKEETNNKTIKKRRLN